ncbi:MAG: DUF6569 family protein [Vicinamibacterales bacterium]
MQTNPLAATLATVTLGPELVVDNLTMFPLLRAADASVPLDYSVLDEALAAGVVEITEVSEQRGGGCDRRGGTGRRAVAGGQGDLAAGAGCPVPRRRRPRAAASHAGALGLGEDFRLTTPHIAGAALAVEHHVVHVSAFVV